MQIIAKWAGLFSVTSLFTTALASHTPNEAPFVMAGGCPYVYASIDGHAGWFVLDTGCSISVLDPKIVKSLGVKPDDDGLYNLPNLEVGGAGLKSVKFTDDWPSIGNPTRATSGVPIIGFLGYNATRMLAFGIDFKARKAFFWGTRQGEIGKAAFFGSTTNLDSVPVLNQDGQPRITIKLNDRPFFAFMDTGSLMTSIPKPAQNWAGDDISLSVAFFAYTVLGALPTRFMLTRELAIGANRLDCVPMCETASSQMPLTVGASVLATFHKVFFDLDGGSISFRQTPQKLIGLNGLACLAGLQELGDPNLPKNTFTKILSDTSSPDWRRRMKTLQDAVQRKGPANPTFPMNINVEPPPGLKNIWPPKDVYFSPFLDGPGLYAPPGSPVMVTFAATNQPKDGPQKLGPVEFPSSIAEHMIAVGGVPLPIPKRSSEGSWLAYRIRPPFDEAHEMAMDDDSKDLIVFNSPGQPTDYKPDKPVTVDWDDLVDNAGNWTPVPAGPNKITYYPPGMKIPVTRPAR